MTILLMISRSILLISVILYLYYFFRRKQPNVVIIMWLIIIVGLLAGVAGKLIEVNLGISNWGSIQISLYLSFAIFSYSLWKLLLELKKKRP